MRLPETILLNNFGLNQFRKGQREIIDSVLAKSDTLAVLPTGGGKSLCYQLPCLLTEQLVIVVSPLIALMKDQVAALHKQGLAAGALHSGQAEDDKRRIFADIQKGGPYLLYLSPERVAKEGFKKWIRSQKIALFAIDEAHCVSQWGHDFREEYAELKVLKSLRPDVPILALTASATPTVLLDVAKNLQLMQPKKLIYGFYRPNLYYQVEACADEIEKLGLLLQSVQQNPTGRVIVYCGTRKTTEEVAHQLSKKFEKVGFYHAGLSSEARSRTQENYAAGELRILIATNAFGMGIDQPDVRLVVHYQLPANLDSLYQEMGRAGRDNKPATCLMLYSKKDKGLQSFFIQSSTAPDAIKDARWRNLDALISYSEAEECRHAEILTYYKDTQRITRCGHCDVCDPQSALKIRPAQIYVEQSSQKATAKTKTRKKSLFNTEILNSADEELFLELKAWRKAKAKELDLPSFVIFGDKTLRELAKKRPQNSDSLSGIYGIGEAKIESFGKDLLSILKSFS